MAEETSWFSHYSDEGPREVVRYESYGELCDEGNEEVTAVSVESFLPDELLERIIAYLPIASVIRAKSVCKRWNGIVSSKKYVSAISLLPPQKPWYFMFTSCYEPTGYAYDPLLRNWYGLELPCIEASNWFVASSCGLVCFMDNDSRRDLYVCNPLTKIYKKLERPPPGFRLADCYSALAFWADRISSRYTITVVKSKQVAEDFSNWDVSVHLYDSQTKLWLSPVTEVMSGWRGGEESVVCDGVLYFLIYSTWGGAQSRHGLISYNLSARSSHKQLINSFIRLPCALTCGRLMNLREKMVLVGGIGKPDCPDIIKGIGIWVLNGKSWEEIARMPHKYFQGFGEFHEVFASSGVDDLIYIQSYGGPALLLFDMRLKHWRWSQKGPVTKRFPLELFTGFCFEPRLEINP